MGAWLSSLLSACLIASSTVPAPTHDGVPEPADPAQEQVSVAQGAAILIESGGEVSACTVGYNDGAVSYTAAHCVPSVPSVPSGADSARVALWDPATGEMRSDWVGTIASAPGFAGRANDFATITWGPGIKAGPNDITGEARLDPGEVEAGETVCYAGSLSHPGGGATCGKAAGTINNTVYFAGETSHPGDSGGPVWVPGRGFLGVLSGYIMATEQAPAEERLNAAAAPEVGAPISPQRERELLESYLISMRTAPLFT
ncbi:trypsin-like serine protease [Corynebacterium liangguodongii]|uniref:Uncharacterized protein n=1 Tax=Corynebacterium liangguodongii TaxID=2079535 RepID=A0A2S0WCU8_9CORY|nr:trypsin-like serine protease [Corynebacterium liangguodongii]AWB83502.1 hypothetical protein C3E79_02520 [Corynebacterium liangguodongii]PWC00409.1 hypothetical protein DF219_00435 [Corynebacterium liangguodongii]